MKILGTILSLPLLLLGGIFLLAAAHPDAVAQHKSLPRAVAGLCLIGGAGALLALSWRSRGAAPSGAAPGSRAGQEAPGPLAFKAMTCPHCGGQVEAGSVRIGADGVATAACGYCHGTFLIQEDPKW